MDEKKSISKLARVGLRIVLLALGISIVFFIPFLPLGLVLGKGVLLILGAAVGVVFYFLDSLSVGRFILPQGKTWKVLLGVVLTSALTSFFVPHPTNSFLGLGFSTMTVSTLAIAFVYFFLIQVWGYGVNFTKLLFKTIFISGFVAIFFGIIQLIFDIVGRFPKFFISLGNSNLVGSFHDFAFILALFVVFLTFAIENNFWRGGVKMFLISGIVLSLAFLFIINYTLLWYLIGLSGLSLLIVQLMPQVKNNEADVPPIPVQDKKPSILAFVLVFCAFVGVVGASNISQFFIKPPFNFSANETRPNILSTVSIVKNTYYNNPLTGAGLNRFNTSWEMGKHKVLGGGLISSPYWSVSFDNASSLFLGFITTLGIVAGALFIWFVLLIAKHIVNLFNKNSLQKSRSYDLFIYGFSGVYGFLIFMFDVPSTALFVLSIAVFSMVVIRNQSLGGLPNKEFLFINDSRHSFFSILTILLSIIATMFLTFVLLRTIYSGVLVNRAALQNATKEGVAKADALLTKALKIHTLDNYARVAVDARLVAIDVLLQDKNQTQEAIGAVLNTEITNAANAAKLAISLDPKNYQNYISLLKVQETMFQLGDTNGYNNAIENTQKILELSPKNIGIIFRQAKIATILKKYDAAYMFIDRIHAINPGFVDAYLLRSQVALAEGNTEKALLAIGQGMEVNPYNAILPYQKGLIYSNQSNHSAAVVQFEKASVLAPGSMDVYSSLAVSYEKLGQRDSVLRVLNQARSYFSDTTQIDELIKKVQNGGTLSNTTIESEVKEEEEATEENKKIPQ